MEENEGKDLKRGRNKGKKLRSLRGEDFRGIHLQLVAKEKI